MRSASMRETSYSRSVRRRRRNDSVSIRSSSNAEEVRIIVEKVKFVIISLCWSGEQQPVLSSGEDDVDDRAGREVAIPVLLLFVITYYNTIALQ